MSWLDVRTETLYTFIFTTRAPSTQYESINPVACSMVFAFKYNDSQHTWTLCHFGCICTRHIPSHCVKIPSNIFVRCFPSLRFPLTIPAVTLCSIMEGVKAEKKKKKRKKKLTMHKYILYLGSRGKCLKMLVLGGT